MVHSPPIRYRGYYYDDDTGLYYLNARYYSPKWRRFISPDDTTYLDPETVNGLNLYCYCGNDPVNFVDPSGHSVAPIAIAISNIVKGKLQFPSTNFVEMAHCTTSVQSNRIIGGLFWNLSYTVTTQKDNAETFYAYGNIGNSGVSYGGGVNLGDWFGASGYISSNIGIGANVQLTPWVTAGAEVSLLNGISVSAGLILGNTTHEISVNVGWGTIAGAYALASFAAATLIPGARALAGAAACLIFLIDLFI